MFSRKSNTFKNFVENTNKLAQKLQPLQQNSNENSTIKKGIFGGQSKIFNNTNKKSESEDLIMKSNYSYSNEKHVKGICQLLENSVLGASTHDSRADKGKDGYNASLKFVVESINKYGGSNGKKGFLFSDCDLTAHDMNYLSATMISSSYNFAIVDFSNNPKIDALAIDYLLKGETGILSVKQGNLTDMNLMYQGILTRYNFVFHKLDLSGCNIGDVGADILGHALANGKLKCLKNIDISGNNISTPKITELLKQVSQDLFVVTEKSYEEGKAVYKSTDGKLYDMHIKSDEKYATVEFADGITGISGISAGDTCPAPIKDQIQGCILGGVSGATKGLYSCKGTGKSKLFCIAQESLAGCTLGTIAVGLKPCTSIADIYKDNYKDNDKGDFGFTVDGGTEIKGTYIDNDHGLTGSNFDLTKHDFN